MMVLPPGLDADPHRALEDVHDLFLELANDADQLDAPVLYAIAKEGRAGPDPDNLPSNLDALFDAIVEHVPPPIVEDGGFQMLVSNRGHDDYTGSLAVGRISRGSVGPGDEIAVLGSGLVDRARVGQVLVHRGLGREAVDPQFRIV